MKKITLLLMSLLLGLTYVQAQDTGDIPIDEEHFSDANFREYLSAIVDWNSDNILCTEERASVIDLDAIGVFGCSFLDGLHYFPNLKSITPNYYIIDSIDLTGCSSLRSLRMTGKNHYLYIKALSDCSQLDTLVLYGNLPNADWQLPSSLTYIDIQSDSLRHFDFDLPNLADLLLSTPNLTRLDLTNYPGLKHLYIAAPLAELNWPNQFMLEAIVLWGTRLPALTLRNQTSLKSFGIYYDFLIQSIDLSGCLNITQGLFGGLWPTGFNDCPHLEYLNLSDCANIGDFDCSRNGLTSLNLSGMTSLEHIRCAYNQLKNLDVSGLTSLSGLDCSNNQLENLDLSGLTSLSYLNCSNNQLENLDLSGLTSLSYLNCYNNQLENLDLSGLSSLTELNCSHNQLKSLLLSDVYNLRNLNFSKNHISALDLESFWQLKTVLADSNQLAFLNINTDLTQSDSYYDKPFSANNNFHPVRLNAQHAFNLDLLPGFGVSKMRRIEGGVLNGKMLTFLQDTVRYEYRCADNGISAFFALVNDPTSAPGDLPISAANFPDEHFRAYIRTHFDTDKNDSLSDEECIAVTEIDVADLQIKTLQGLHYFVYLKYLNADNNQLTSLDLSRNGALEVLSCNANSLAVETDAAFSFDLASLPDFDVNRVKFCRGGTINGTRLTFKRDTVSFEYLTYYAGAAVVPQSVAFQLVTELPESAEFGGLPISEANFPDEIFRLYVSDHFDRNANDSLSERELAMVEEINVVNMGIKNLKGIEHFSFLERLDCSHNQLTALNLSGNHALQTLYCYENSLFVTLDSLRRFDLRTLPDFDPERAENWKGGIVSGNTLVFIADEVSYAYRHRQAGDGNIPATVSFTLTSAKTTPNEYAEAADLFSVHPVPFRQTLHIETALNLKSVSLYNMPGRLCARFEHGFDALPTADLEPGLYLLLLETADGATYRLKAVKE